MFLDESRCNFFGNDDAFVNLSRGNEIVQEVLLDLSIDPASRTGWGKVAEGIGNLQALRNIIVLECSFGDNSGEAPVPNWEFLACILRRLGRGIQLDIQDAVGLLGDQETLPVFAGVIHGQAMITGFSTREEFPLDCLDLLCPTLLTLPALENVSFRDIADQDTEDGQSLENMVQLPQSPVLRVVKFDNVSFSDSLSRAIAKALKERSQITDLDFSSCSFEESGGIVIASALKTNTTLKRLEFDASVSEVFYDVLAAALLSNSTLQKLALRSPDGTNSSWLSPLFLALQVNTGLKELQISFASFRFNDGPPVNLMDEKLSTVMRLGLGRNSTLESLYLSNITSTDNDTSLWRDAFSFLRTNTALKHLTLDFELDVTESYATAIRMVFPAVLCENKSLETLSIGSPDARFEDYLVFVAAIQPNTTLKKLHFQNSICRIDKGEAKNLVSALKKNYGLEVFPALIYGGGNVCSILQLNRASGASLSCSRQIFNLERCRCAECRKRRYQLCILASFGESETMRPHCRRNAECRYIENVTSTNPRSHIGNGGGKREQQAPAHMCKESRRRLE
jgi:hypothetical protein